MSNPGTTTPTPISTPRVAGAEGDTGESSPAIGLSGVATPVEEGSQAESTDGRRSSTVHPSATDEDRDLEAFRREWQAEVARRRTGERSSSLAGPSQANGISDADPHHFDEDHHSEQDHEEARPHSPSRTRHLLQLAEDQQRAAAQQESEGGQRVVPFTQPRPIQRFNENAPNHASPATRAQIKAAVQAYASAVESERRGDLDQAVVFYRKAFRIDSSADRLYERAFAMLKRSESNALAQTTDSSSSKSMDKHRDTLLASAEVADMVRRANDFDDYRVEAIERAKEAQEAAKETDNIKTERASTSQLTGQSGADISATRDDLDAIIIRAEQTEVEGRNLHNLTFSAPPSLVSARRKLEDKRMSKVNRITEELKETHIDGAKKEGDDSKQEDDDAPPPPISKLPDEILAHICEMVVEPRGRRGAKIRAPRVDPAVHPVQAGGKGHTSRGGKPIKAVTDAQEEEGKRQTSGGIEGQKPPAASVVSNTSATDATQPAKAPTSQGVGIVLAGPDWQSLEMLGRTCWKWRLVTRSKAAWRRVLQETYHEPQLPLPSPALTTLNPRQTFIQHPRLRLTGCYIAACHYSRQGLSVDNAWVKVIHLVEFYRSIRFLPDGRVFTLLTTDQPKETVGKMHAANLDKGFAVGRWRVELPPSSGSESSDDEGRGQAQRHGKDPRVIIDDLRDRSLAKYSFRMILSLRSTSRGKWNKMEMLDYCSINLETGEVLPLPQKHSRPFHFSAVRSYGV